MKTVHIKTFGCQMNVWDSDRIRDRLASFSLVETARPEDADMILVNTCSVRDHAEKRALGWISELGPAKAMNGNLVVGVMGCVAQRLGAGVLSAAPNVDFVVGTDAYGRFGRILERLMAGERQIIDVGPENDSGGFQKPATRRIRAFVSVMKGCDNYCSYCVVPFVRGRERSRPVPEILEEVECLVGAGTKDVTLLGQNVNSYRSDGLDFSGLLRRVSRVPGLLRLRFTTSHPKDLTMEIVNAVSDSPAVCEHIHLPAQSGSDRILELMNRAYTREHYLGLVGSIRARIPEVSITTDLMVGFPGETEDDFEDTLDLMSRAEFDSSFAFKFSPRPDTAAAGFKETVSRKEKERRLDAVLTLQRKMSEARNVRLTGRTLEVLIEGKAKGNRGLLAGRTRSNKVVLLESDAGEPGRLAMVEIVDARGLTLSGKEAGGQNGGLSQCG